MWLGLRVLLHQWKKVSDDLFTAPVSDYRRTLWYNTYDVSHLLQKGENIFAAICGNGWFNESFKTTWQQSLMQFRDVPKFILRLEIDGKTALVSDNTWKCLPESATFFNQLRSGEYFDSNLYEENWNTLEYDDSDWKQALKDTRYPTGVFRECMCEPIREFESYEPINTYKTGEYKYVFDLGQNIAGYVNITVTGNKGDVLTICHAENINDDLSLNYNDLHEHHGSEVCIQQDRFICSGKRFNWSPKFTYHGFRYVEVDGIRNIDDFELRGIFVHQAVKQKTKFECSNDALNKMFRMGIMSCYSNMYYLLADCPTREKMGWMNDMQSSTEQFLTNFESDKFFEKIIQDIYDSMLSDGSIPSIVPSFGWGYSWGDGPVCDGAMFEIPYRLYLHTGKKETIVSALPYFKKYLRYLRNRKNDDGLIDIGLWDWAAPNDKDLVGRHFINAVLEYAFYKITELSAKVAEDADAKYYKELAKEQKKFVIEKYIDDKGRCTINEQTSVGMLIFYDLYDELEPLKQQLIETVESQNYHHNCGMVGLRRLYYALDKCGLSEYAYKIINVDGCPGYKYWLEKGATTLWEYWESIPASRNHHMYSDFMSWIVKNLGGISLDENKIGSLEYILNPKYIDDLKHVKCSSDGIEVDWHRENDIIILKIKVDKGVKLNYNGKLLECGEHIFNI